MRWEAGSQAAGRIVRRGLDSHIQPPDITHLQPCAMARVARLLSLRVITAIKAVILLPFRPAFVLGFIFSMLGEFLLSARPTIETFFRVGNYLFYVLYKGHRKAFHERRDIGPMQPLCSFFSRQTIYIIIVIMAKIRSGGYWEINEIEGDFIYLAGNTAVNVIMFSAY